MISPSRRPAVTMIELLVVIGVLLILAALLIPAIAKVREAASRAQSTNNLRQLALAIHNFNDTYRKLPPTAGRGVDNQTGSLHFHLLPFIEQDALFKQAKGDSWNLAGTVLPILINPQDPTLPEHRYQNAFATTNYAGNWMAFKTGDNNIPASFPDGTSNTSIFATRYQLCNGTPTAWAYPTIYTWTPMYGYYTTAKFQVAPRQAECDPTVPQSLGPVILVGLCDGSVRFVNGEVSPLTWYCLTDPADGQPLGNDF